MFVPKSLAVVFQVWEALVTLLFFPVCVLLAWIADRRLLFYKYMGKRYRADKRHGIVVETEGDLTPTKGGMEMITDGKLPQGSAVVPAENGGDGAAGATANNIGAAAVARGNLPNSNSATVNVESGRELDESRKEVRHRKTSETEEKDGSFNHTVHSVRFSPTQDNSAPPTNLGPGSVKLYSAAVLNPYVNA